MFLIRRRLILLAVISSLIGCQSISSTPTATATLTPPPAGTPTATLTSAPSTATPTYTPTVIPPTSTTAASPTPHPSHTPAPTSTPPPTPHTLSIASVPRPTDPISPSNANQVTQLARWTSDLSASEVIFSPDGRLMAITSSQGVHLFDAETLTEVGFIDDGGHWTNGLIFTPDGEILVVGMTTRGVRLWQVSACAPAPDDSAGKPSDACGTFLRTLRDSTGSVPAMGLIAFSPDGETLAAETTQNSVGLWRLAECASPSQGCDKRLHTLPVGPGSITSLSFSADGQTLLVGIKRSSISFSGAVQLWQVASGELLYDLTVTERRESHATFSPDGTILAAAGDDEKISLWEMATGMPLRHLVGHTNQTRSVAFAPDGTVLATSAADGTVRLWHVSDGTLLHTLQGTAKKLVFSPDGVWLISTPGDETIQFWGIDPSSPPRPPAPTPTPPPIASATGRLTRIGDLPPGQVLQVWFSPDDQPWLVTETGLFIQTVDGWRPIFDGLANRVLGLDDQGRVWAILNDGWRIGAYADATWTFYGADAGWSRGYGHNLVTDRLGRVWTSTGNDLRRFDPQTEIWTTFSADDIGFPPLEEPMDPGRSLTDVALDSAGNVWVGSCIHSGIVILGQGVRWFDGERWSGSIDTTNECVYDIDVDDAGRVWMSGFDALIQYDPNTRAWSRFPLPPWERTQLINSVALDTAGRPWVNFTRFGGAGPWHSNAIYHLEDGVWVADYDPGIDLPIQLTFGPDGAAWICAAGTIYRLEGGQPQEIDAIGWCRQTVVDGLNRVWVVSDSGLWQLEPGE